MAEDRELPNELSFIHSKFSTPHVALGVLIVATSVIAAIGVRSVVGLTGITLASNFGTFVLYGLTCIWTVVAFTKDKKEFSFFKHRLIPALGVVANVCMLVAIIYLYSVGNPDARAEAYICFMIAGAWALISGLYVLVTTARKTTHLKMVSGLIRPEQLNVLVQALKEEDYIMGMTVTKVKGFGRQKGQIGEVSPVDENISFLPKVKVDLVVKEWDVPRVMDIIGEAVRTGNVGDGKIFVIDASDALRVRTGERGVGAI